MIHSISKAGFKATLFCPAFLFAISAGAANIDATVQSTTKKYATVTTKSNAMPKPGDKANIYFKIPGGNVEVSVATGHVYEITGKNIMIQIDQATGTVAKNQLVRINSPHPITPGASPTASPSPGKSSTPLAKTSPSPQPNNSKTGKSSQPTPSVSAAVDATRASKPAPATGGGDVSQKIVGTWQGPVHQTEYLADGTFVIDPKANPSGPRGRWRMHGDELIRTDGKNIQVYKIISVNDTEVVVRDEKNATWHLKRLP